MVKALDANLSRFADIVGRDLGKEVADVAGAGAAGGLGAGLVAFLGAMMRPGVEIVAEAAGLERKMQGSALVITGEGKLDRQTAFGKTMMGVATLAHQGGTPVTAVVGSLGEGWQDATERVIDALAVILDKPMTLEEALADAHSLVCDATERMCRTLTVGVKMGRRSHC